MAYSQVTYQPKWQVEFQQLKQALQATLGPNLTNCQHIGSTAIPTITARPVIDILLEFQSIPADLNIQLARLGYQASASTWLPAFESNDSQVPSQLFITKQASNSAKRAIALRDYLNAHRTDARKYQEIKTNRLEPAAKTALIAELTDKANDWLTQLAAHDTHDRMVRAELVNMCFIYDRATDQVVVENKIDAKWPGLTLPGGHVNRGESQTAAMVREVQEETGLTISHLQLAGTVTWVENAQGDVSLGTLYRTEQFTGDLLPGSYEGTISWMPVKELLQGQLAPGLPAILQVFLHPELTEAFWGNSDSQLRVY